MDIILWVIVGSFIVWELYAHFIGKNKSAHTLSNRIWALQKRHPKVRVVTVLVLVVLILHLAVGWL